MVGDYMLPYSAKISREVAKASRGSSRHSPWSVAARKELVMKLAKDYPSTTD